MPQKALWQVSLAGFLVGAVVVGISFLLPFFSWGIILLSFGLSTPPWLISTFLAILIFLVSRVIGSSILKFFRVQFAAEIALYGSAGVLAGHLLFQTLGLSLVLEPSSDFSIVAKMIGLYVLLLPLIGGVAFALSGRLYRDDLSRRIRLIILFLLFGINVAALILADYLPDAQYRKEEARQIEQLDFDVYTPSFIPPEYRANEPYLLGGEDLGRKISELHFKITYLYRENDEGGRAPIELRQLKVTDKYRPPTDCGSLHPEYDWEYSTNIANPCENVGFTTGGDPVYLYNAEDGSGESFYYLRRGETLIVLSTDSLTGYYENPLTRGEVLQILSSLEKLSAEELKSLTQY